MLVFNSYSIVWCLLLLLPSFDHGTTAFWRGGETVVKDSFKTGLFLHSKVSSVLDAISHKAIAVTYFTPIGQRSCPSRGNMGGAYV